MAIANGQSLDAPLAASRQPEYRPAMTNKNEGPFAQFQGRACPAWFAQPQLGIFIHWGLFSVPAFAPRGANIHDLLRDDYDNVNAHTPYAEWYQNAASIAGSASAAHHAAHYGDAPYADFRQTFDASATAFDANAWADLFAASGASYIVFVTKHHDGYCLWPSEIAHPHRPGWHTKRDFVGELADAVRARGMRFGLYYSGGLDWTFYHHPIRDLGDMLACVPTSDAYCAYASAQLKELITRYEPSVLWNDIAWPDKADVPDLFAHYYRTVPDGVINDRWLGERKWFASLADPAIRKGYNDKMKAVFAASGGTLSMGDPAHCDFRTVEYGLGTIPAAQKWEACRGVGLSFGYNQNEAAEDYLTPEALALARADVAEKGGNFLINIGPMADGTIPEIQRKALLGE